MAVTITPTSAACGAEISGVDLRQPLSGDDVSEIRRAWLDHLVIVFRDQDLTPADHKRACGHFGKIGEYNRPKERQHPKHASDEIMLISNIRKDGKPIGSFGDGEMWFHGDTCYYPVPNKITMLYAMELPSHGGNTRVNNMYAAYDRIPAELKARLEGHTVLQIHDYKRTERIDPDGDIEGMLHQHQPIFVTNPETGRRALYVNRLMSAKIDGFPRAESDAILEQLFEIAEDPDLYYEHTWRLGDLLMWDNRCSIHARTEFPKDEDRLLRRCTVKGEAMRA